MLWTGIFHTLVAWHLRISAHPLLGAKSRSGQTLRTSSWILERGDLSFSRPLIAMLWLCAESSKLKSFIWLDPKRAGGLYR